MIEYRISYKGEPAGIIVQLVHTYKRGDISGPVMSASSGPKDYVKNDIFAAFESDPSIEVFSGSSMTVTKLKNNC